MLASRYGWTFDEIADMNHYQQLEALKVSESEKTTTFASMDDYQRWRQRTV